MTAAHNTDWENWDYVAMKVNTYRYLIAFLYAIIFQDIPQQSNSSDCVAIVCQVEYIQIE